MRCIVCGSVFEGNECPICAFPVVNFPDVTDMEKNLNSIKPITDAHKKEFDRKVRVLIHLYKWKYNSGVIEKDSEEDVCFGFLSELKGKTTWSSNKFDRLSERPSVEVCIKVCISSESGEISFEHIVSVPNPKGDDPQQLGITVTDDYRFSLCVKNKSGEYDSSEERFLFDGEKR